MSDDWDTVTKIGSRTRGAGGGGPRETVVRSAAALNAARRSGAAISTEKKYAFGNATGNPEGQRLTKVANEDGIVKPKVINPKVARAMKDGREAMEPKMNQQQLAQKVNIDKSLINAWERGEGAPDQQAFGKIQRIIGVKLNAKEEDIGKPLFKSKKA